MINLVGKFIKVTFDKEVVTLPVENFNGEEVVFLPLSDDIGLKLKLVSDLSSLDLLELYSVSRVDNRQKFLNKVDLNKKTQVGPINIGYFGTDKLTGLQFKSNPGSFFIYPGLFFIICGVFVAFGSKKQIWAQATSNNKILIGGKSDRAKGKFYEEFESLILELVKKG